MNDMMEMMMGNRPQGGMEMMMGNRPQGGMTPQQGGMGNMPQGGMENIPMGSALDTSVLSNTLWGLPIGMLLTGALFILLLVFMIWAVRASRRRLDRSQREALGVLHIRLARGELAPVEYAERANMIRARKRVPVSAVRATS